jgi:hypothetical protein
VYTSIGSNAANAVDNDPSTLATVVGTTQDAYITVDLGYSAPVAAVSLYHGSGTTVRVGRQPFLQPPSHSPNLNAHVSHKCYTVIYPLPCLGNAVHGCTTSMCTSDVAGGSL